jgi:hypothetical protein
MEWTCLLPEERSGDGDGAAAASVVGFHVIDLGQREKVKRGSSCGIATSRRHCDEATARRSAPGCSWSSMDATQRFCGRWIILVIVNRAREGNAEWLVRYQPKVAKPCRSSP